MGKGYCFILTKFEKFDGKKTTTEPITNIWTDIVFQDIAREGNVVLLKGKKPDQAFYGENA